MNGLIIAMAALSGFVLAGLGLSFLAVFRAGSAVKRGERRARSVWEAQQTGLESLRQVVDGLAVQLHEVRAQPHPALPYAAPRGGLNLSRRSQALRLHRRGQPPGQIAAELEIPLQEVQLLLKVHEIVMSHI